MPRVTQSSDLTIAQRRALLQVRIREDVEKHGAFIMVVFGSESEPQWAYSIGIPTTFPGAAEIMLFSLDPDTMGRIINDIVRQMREGRTFEAGQRYEGILRGMPVYFGRVEEKHYDSHFGQAQIYHRSEVGFPVLQLVWPDTKGKFPWEDGFEEKFRKAQPLLFDPKGERQG